MINWKTIGYLILNCNKYKLLRSNIKNIHNIVPEIVELKKKRIKYFFDLINITVDIMLSQTEKVLFLNLKKIL